VVADLPLSGLGPTERLGDGGQGTVFLLPRHPRLLFKRYHDGIDVDHSELARLVELPALVDARDRDFLRTVTAWPCGRVIEGGRLVGFVMPRAPDRFHTVVGGRSRPLELQFLLYPRRVMWQDVPRPDPAARCALAARLIDLFDVLHRNRLLVGDVSMKNFLWTVDGPPGVFAVDCDGFQIPGRSPAVAPAQTLGWQDPAVPAGRATLDSDRYKLALLVLRVLLGDHAVTPVVVVRTIDWHRLLGREVMALAERVLVPGDRPPASHWRLALSLPRRPEPASRNVAPMPRTAVDLLGVPSRPLLRWRATVESGTDVCPVSTPVGKQETSFGHD
jgi:hypothetical protein